MFIRRLPRFEYHAPVTLPEALDLMARYGAKAGVFAGGTDLLVAMKNREIVPEHLVNLKGIPNLKGIRMDEKKGIVLGALTTLSELERSTIVKEKMHPLWDAVNVMASPQVRTLGTIGGNLCSAVPSADTAPPLISLGASVNLVGSKGERSVLLEEFFKGPKESVLRKDEILTEVLVPEPPGTASGAYLKLMRRNALDLALVGVAVYLRFDSNKKICQEAKIALGAVAPTPIRVPEAERVLINKEVNEARAAEAGKAASGICRPISDVRASLEYRCSMVEILTKRAVLEAFKRVSR
jgi:aerobic carbon-monoxide dehydrogenase medium subunit